MSFSDRISRVVLSQQAVGQWARRGALGSRVLCLWLFRLKLKAYHYPKSTLRAVVTVCYNDLVYKQLINSLI
jgi:hypothetical protein